VFYLLFVQLVNFFVNGGLINYLTCRCFTWVVLVVYPFLARLALRPFLIMFLMVRAVYFLL